MKAVLRVSRSEGLLRCRFLGRHALMFVCSVRLRLQLTMCGARFMQGPRGFWWRSGMLRGCDCVDDDQLSAATRARQREGAWRLIGIAWAVVISATLV